MIKNIKELKNFGIFQDYSQKNIQDFNKFNLIYGWNGSGKTTLVELFESLKKKALSDRFSSSKFSITLDSQNKITERNLNESNLNLHIFNDNFVKENIDWDNSVKSILLVAEEKIKERERLKELNIKQETDIEENEKKLFTINELKKEINGFKIQSAKNIKQNLQAIDTNDRYFMNYNKKKFEDFINSNSEGIKKKALLLMNEEKVKQHIEGAKPNKKDIIKLPETFVEFNFEYIKKKEEKISKLLRKTVVSSTIERLISNSDIQSWVEEGLKIHKKHQLNKCEFCDNPLSKDRIKNLEGHFNQEFDNFKKSLSDMSKTIKDFSLNMKDDLPSDEKFYAEYNSKFKDASKELIDVEKNINSYLEKLKNIIDQKIENPFNTSLVIKSIDESLIDSLNTFLNSIKELVKEHNQKTNNFEEETKKNKKALEGHCVTTAIIDFDYYNKLKKLKDEEKEQQQGLINVEKRKKEIQKLENSLSNEGLGVEQINSCLHKFLGRKNLSIQFNKEKKGYDIIRDDENKHSTHLSEGEKRAIAFIYFIIKLEERNNKIKDSIVVVDDPISSLDSNNLFQAYSFLRSRCGGVGQLFVFTHNFTYFKLMRDWLFKQNKNREKDKKPTQAHFFTITATPASPRNAVLETAPKSLINYNSEYHYIFEKLFKFKDSNKLDVNKAFLTANLSRKLLESFFYFKYPKHRSDLSNLLNDGLKDCKNTTPQTKEKIYNFINKYSHSDKIEINDDASENLMGESYNIIGDIFKWIEEVDKVHYKEMVESVNKKKE